MVALQIRFSAILEVICHGPFLTFLAGFHPVDIRLRDDARLWKLQGG
jgi:hypothetical protein